MGTNDRGVDLKSQRGILQGSQRHMGHGQACHGGLRSKARWSVMASAEIDALREELDKTHAMHRAWHYLSAGFDSAWKSGTTSVCDGAGVSAPG